MPAYTVTFNMVDDYERATRKTFESVSTIADETAAVTAVTAILADLEAITECRVLSYVLQRAKATVVDAAVAGANKDEGLWFSVRSTLDNELKPMRIPGPINALFDNSGNLDVTNALIIAFASNFLTGGDWTLSDGEQGSELVSGYLENG